MRAQIVSLVSILFTAAACGPGIAERPDDLEGSDPREGSAGASDASGGTSGLAGTGASATGGSTGVGGSAPVATGGSAGTAPGNPPAGGTGGTSGSGGSSGYAATGGVSGTSGTSGSTGGTVGAGATGSGTCTTPDTYGGSVWVTVRIAFAATDFPLVMRNDLDGTGGNWEANKLAFQGYVQTVEIADYATPGLHRIQGYFGETLTGDRPHEYLVRNYAAADLAVPPTSIVVLFGDACEMQAVLAQPVQAGETTIPAYAVRHAMQAGEQGPNLFICTDPAGCAFTKAPL